MNPSHVAALALVGWYLMVPSPSCAAGSSQTPTGQDSKDSQVRDEIDHEWYEMCPPFTTKAPGVAVSAPFTKWRISTHSLNRDACEKELAGPAFANPKLPKEVVIALQHCRCFSSNDPRLDQKSVRELKQFYLEEAYREGLLKRPPK